MSAEGLEIAIREEPGDPANWLVYADWREEHGAGDQETAALRAIGQALESKTPPPASAFPDNYRFPETLNPWLPIAARALRQAFQIEGNEHHYADYLETMGRITGNELTRLQAEYLRNHLEGRADANPALLARIREETRSLLGLAELPEGSITSSNGRVSFDLYDLPLITALPPGFDASGDTNFSGCPALTSIGDGFHAGGNVSFHDCPALISIGDGFHTLGHAWFSDCPALASIGEGFHASGDADFRDCPALASIGDGFHAGGDAWFSDCPALASIGNSFHTDGDAWFDNCTSLSSISDSFHAGGDAWFTECYALTSIGNGFHASGDAWFDTCPALTSIGNAFQAGENASFNDCPALTSIGNAFQAGRNANFNDCSALASIGDGFHADGNVLLRGCTSPSLTLPPDMVVGGQFLDVPETLTNAAQAISRQRGAQRTPH